MIVFGLVLLILAIVVIAYVWLATAGMSPVSIDYGVLNVELSPLWFFFAGGITLAVATSGLWLIGVGAKASTRRAKEMRELRRQAKESERRTERDQDRAALGSDRDRRGSAPGGSSTSAPRTASSSSDAAYRPGRSASTRTGTSHDGSPQPGAGATDSGRQPILPRPGRDEAPGTQGGTGDRVDPDR